MERREHAQPRIAERHLSEPKPIEAGRDVFQIRLREAPRHQNDQHFLSIAATADGSLFGAGPRSTHSPAWTGGNKCPAWRPGAKRIKRDAEIDSKACV